MKLIHIVLHRPIYPRNVGMCARAIANFAGARLIVVTPLCELGHEAKQGAANAQDVLRNAVIYPDLTAFQAHEGDGIRIALSGRDNRLKEPDYLNRVLDGMKSEGDHPFHNSTIPIYLMFGTEDDGLSPEEMELCHHVCRLPTLGPVTSLNLSHAVLLSLYMVQEALGHVAKLGDGSPDAVQIATDKIEGQPLYYPSETIRRWLLALGFDLSAKRITIEKTLNRILLSRCPSNEELRLIDTVLQQTVRKLSEPKRSSP